MRALRSRPSAEALAWLDTLERRRLEAEAGGPPLTATEERGYSHPEVKGSLEMETSGKCAYCESHVTHAYWGDVEHILPKAAGCRPDLRFSYDNLTLACAICNNAKGGYYDPHTELLNPYVDEPEHHLLSLGPITWAKAGSERAEVTINKIALNRKGLVERRQERLEAVGALARRYLALPTGALRDALLDQLRAEVGKDASYTAHVRAALKALEIPL